LSNAKKPYVIFFFGQNGAGKSTQMELLCNALKDQKIKSRITWIASHNLFVWFLGVILAKLGYPKDHWTKVNPHLRPVANLGFFKNTGKPSKSILLFLEIVSIVLVDLIKIRIPKLLGNWVIVEKYIPITLADLTLIYSRPFFKSMAARFLLRLVPANAYGIFLEVDYEDLLKRRGEKIESKKYLGSQDVVCKWYATHYNCLIVDTSKIDVKKTHGLIIDYLNIP
jgi:energy-coupling factor transporter ATP-binding protein EcfA2